MQPFNTQTRNIFRFKNGPENEQTLIREFFKDKSNGFYVDVGANEPVIQSQTYHLECIGWTGILIEPIPDYCTLLRNNRSGKTIQCACSSPQNHGKELKLNLAAGHSTLNEKPIAVGSTSDESIIVPCRTLDSILEDQNTQRHFEFISIDIEGHEMEMFKGFSLAYWQPQLVLLEDHVINHEKHNHMTSNGYQLILRTGLNSWYVPKSMEFKLSTIAYLQYLRKYWLGLPVRKLRFSNQF